MPEPGTLDPELNPFGIDPGIPPAGGFASGRRFRGIDESTGAPNGAGGCVEGIPFAFDAPNGIVDVGFGFVTAGNGDAGRRGPSSGIGPIPPGGGDAILEGFVGGVATGLAAI